MTDQAEVSEEISTEQIHEMFVATEAVIVGLLKTRNANELDSFLMGLVVSIDEAAAEARRISLVLPRTESIYGKLEVVRG